MLSRSSLIVRCSLYSGYELACYVNVNNIHNKLLCHSAQYNVFNLFVLKT